MGIRIVFLDFDGVLNHYEWFTLMSQKRDDPMSSRKAEDAFDPNCAKLVQELCEKFGAKIVVSSSWRYGRSISELTELLRGVGIQAQIIDKTPSYLDENDELVATTVVSALTRGREIAEWLRQNKEHEVSGIVILDDDRDIAPLERWHVKTSFRDGGLRQDHLRKAEELLALDWPSKLIL
jgi:hypothetical protein